jgi:hypothetical protein
MIINTLYIHISTIYLHNRRVVMKRENVNEQLVSSTANIPTQTIHLSDSFSRTLPFIYYTYHLHIHEMAMNVHSICVCNCVCQRFCIEPFQHLLPPHSLPSLHLIQLHPKAVSLPYHTHYYMIPLRL